MQGVVGNPLGWRTIPPSAHKLADTSLYTREADRLQNLGPPCKGGLPAGRVDVAQRQRGRAPVRRKRRSRRGDCAGGIGEISQQTKDGRSRPYVFLSILLYWESSIIRSMQRTAFSAISGGTVISWPAVPCRQPSTSPRVVAFILWHTQSLDRG
mgnify:CR=1 FL=1